MCFSQRGPEVSVTRQYTQSLYTDCYYLVIISPSQLMAPRASETHTQVPHITSGAYLLNTSQGNVEKSHTGTAAPTAVLNFPQNQLDCCESPESPAIRRMMFVTLRSEQPRAATDCSKSRWLLPGGLNWGTSGCCSEFCHAVTKQG